MLLSSVKRKQVCIVAILSAIGLTTLAWNDPSFNGISSYEKMTDTIPPKSQNNPRIYDDRNEPNDIDQRIEQLERAIESLNSKLEQKDWEKMQQKLEESLNKIDMEKMQQKVDEAMKKIDMNQIMLESEKAMKKVNWEKIQQEIKAAMAEANNSTHRQEMQKELQQAMKEVRKAMEESKKIDYEKIRQEMQKAREQWQNQQGQIRNELEKARAEINENKVNLKNEVMKAREEVREAKDELQSYKILLTRMEEDGLINTKGDYSISYRKGELFINGKKQSQETTDKYKSFFKRDNVEIKKEKGNFSLNNADK